MNALLAHAPALAGVPRAGIVHRLDKDTSGLLVVAKTVEAQADLVKQLADRTMRRVYLALVQGDPPASGTIDAPVGRDARARTRMAVTHRGKPARTTYRVLERFGRAALVECRLETGRTHRSACTSSTSGIRWWATRCTAAATRHGIAFPRQALHAAELSLRHPSSGEPLTWRSPLPRDFKAPRRRAALVLDLIRPDWPARVGALFTTATMGDMATEEARARLRSLLPGEPRWLHQVHGARIVATDDALRRQRRCVVLRIRAARFAS